MSAVATVLADAAPDVAGIVTEVLSWAGLGGAVAVLAIALVVAIADGTWLPTRGAVDSDEDGALVRWFDADGNINQARLTDADVRALGGADMADIWYRRGWLGRMRLHRRSHAVRALVRIAALLGAVGVISVIVQIVLMAARS